jgi:hypothetical protein
MTEMFLHSSTYTNPSSREVAELISYTCSGPIATSKMGRDVTDSDREHYHRIGRGQEISRLYSVAFANEHSHKEIADRAQSVAKKHLGGQVLIGVHDGDEETNSHLHLAEVGSKDESWYTIDEYRAFRNELAEQFPDEDLPDGVIA